MKQLVLALITVTAGLNGCLLFDTGRPTMEDEFDSFLERYGHGDHVVVARGHLDRMTFAPERCSSERPVCDDGFRMAVGYEGELRYRVDDADAGFQMELESTDPSVLEVRNDGSFENRHVFLVAHAPGTATVIARKADGTEHDRLDMEVRSIAAIAWELEEQADGERTDAGLTVPAGEDVEIFVSVLGETSEQLMAPVDWQAAEGNLVSFGTENFHDFNYMRTIDAHTPGQTSVTLDALGVTTEIVVTVTE